MKKSDGLFLMAAIYFAHLMNKEGLLVVGFLCLLVGFIIRHRGD